MEESNLNDPISLTNPPLPVPPNNRKLLTINFILTVLLVISSLIAVYFYLNPREIVNPTQIDQPESPKAVDSEILIPSPTLIPSPEFNETINSTSSDWIDFESSTYSLSYPNDFQRSDDSGGVLVLTLLGETQVQDTEIFDGIMLRFQPRELEISADEFAKNQIKQMEDSDLGELIAPITPIEVNGYKGVIYTSSGLGEFDNIILKAESGMLLSITILVADPENKDYVSLVDEVLATVEIE